MPKIHWDGARVDKARHELCYQWWALLTPVHQVFMSTGTIKKLVKVEVAGNARAACETEGYGIIRSDEGQEIFFVNSVVEGARFEELRQGQRVTYTIEEGPLGRAAVVKLP